MRASKHRIRWPAPLALAALAFPGSGDAPSDEPRVAPAIEQVELILKVLTFDYTLQRDPHPDLVIAVIEDPLDLHSSSVADTIFGELRLYEGQLVWGRALNVLRRSIRDLLAKDDPGIEALYLAPGLKKELPRALAWCRRNHCFSFSGMLELRAKGVAVWVGEDQKGPRIRINLPQARAEGHDLDPRLLTLAMVER